MGFIRHAFPRFMDSWFYVFQFCRVLFDFHVAGLRPAS